MPQDMPKVLLIESEYRLRLRYKSLFKKAGFELAGESGNLDVAETLAKESRPGVVLVHLGAELADTANIAKLAQLFLLDVLFAEYCRCDLENCGTARERVASALAEKHL